MTELNAFLSEEKTRQLSVLDIVKILEAGGEKPHDSSLASKK
jgi:hypothetical protein